MADISGYTAFVAGTEQTNDGRVHALILLSG